jgi:hypothetical protein
VESETGSLASAFLPEIVVGYVRLAFCDALQLGACDRVVQRTSEQQDEGPESPSPLLTTDEAYTNYLYLENAIGNSSSNNNTVPSPHPNQPYAGGEDETYLPLVGNGGDGGIVSSPWLAITLRSLSGSNGTYRARHVYNVSLSANVTSGVRFVMTCPCAPEGPDYLTHLCFSRRHSTSWGTPASTLNTTRRSPRRRRTRPLPMELPQPSSTERPGST